MSIKKVFFSFMLKSILSANDYVRWPWSFQTKSKHFLWIMLIKVSIKVGIRRSKMFLSPCLLMMHSLFYLNIRWVSQYKKDIENTVPCIPFLHFSTYDLNLNSRRMIFQTGFNLKCKLNGRVILFSIKSLCEIVCIPAVFYSVSSFQAN